MTNALPAEPLTATAFAPFGEVLQDDSAKMKWINDNTTRRFDCLAKISADGGGQAAISLFRAMPRPLEIAMLECHPLGSQIFLPASDADKDWLVVVAKGDSQKPDWNTLRCFVARGTQGVHYFAGAWHHPVLVLHSERDFWVADRAPPPNEPPFANLREFYCPPELRARVQLA